ncbi:MAG TPA: tetratricopeptide repeat protein [Thermoanaerobaculia bacterium]
MASFAPSRQDLEALLARRQGDLRDEPYRLLLLAIATRRESGVLTLTRGPLEKEVVFDSGTAVGCESNIATETLGRFLVSSGRISEAQYRDALSASGASGVEQLIPAAELSRAVQQSLGRRLLEPFSWTSGTWQFSHETSAEATHRVRVPQLLVTGIGKVEPFETVEAALQDAGAMQLSLGPSPLFDASELRLSEEQQRVLAAIRNGASLDQFSGNEDLQRFVYALLLLGIAAPAAERAAPFFELDIAPEPPRSAGFQPAAPPASSRPPALTQPEPAPQFAPSGDLLATHADYRQKDPFALLGLEATAGVVEINRAFVRAAERFLPSRYEEQVRDKAQELLLAAARAYAELADPTRRQALVDRRANKPAAPPVAAAAPPPPPPQPTPSQRRRAIIDPEELYRQGRAAAAAGKLREALGYYEMAADCDAQNGTYAAEVAYTRYQLLGSPAATTVKALKNAIRIDPRCGVAYLYLGKIQEALGNHIEAQAYLGRASMLGAR